MHTRVSVTKKTSKAGFIKSLTCSYPSAPQLPSLVDGFCDDWSAC